MNMQIVKKIIEMFSPIFIFLFTLFFGLILRKIIFNRLIKWAKSTESHMDDIIIESIKSPFIIWCAILGIYFTIETSNLHGDLVHTLNKILLVLGIFSVTLVLSNIETKSIKAYSGKIQSALPITSLTQNVSRILIFVIGILVILHNLGISITPILATLGVGSLAVALGLQDTLSNLFAGFYIIMAKQFRVGDYIKLESGEEGYIADINLRSTKIRTLPNNIILVPNEKLTKSIIVNYYLPNKEIAVSIKFGVHYKSDLDKVEKVTIDVAKQVLKEVPGGVPEFVPIVRYNNFGDHNIQLTVILRAKEFIEQDLIKHEFIKKLHDRYLKENIVIPYPITAINYEQEKANIEKERVS